VPHLNPAPGKILITEPLSRSETEQRELAKELSSAFPQLWEDWRSIESGIYSSDDALRPINSVLRLSSKPMLGSICHGTNRGIFQHAATHQSELAKPLRPQATL